MAPVPSRILCRQRRWKQATYGKCMRLGDNVEDFMHSLAGDLSRNVRTMMSEMTLEEPRDSRVRT